ncbi:MAG: B12-binding domain-containing radical SAM protein [Endomicrobiales bacterium]
MIALVNIVSKFRTVEDKTRPPSGLLYVGGALKNAGHEVRVFHLYEREIAETVADIESLAPLFVGFTVFTGYPCYTSALMSKMLKQRMPGLPVVWGGVHPSLDPEGCLREDFVDFTVMGEGEETILELAGEIAGGRRYAGIKGIGYKENGKTVVTPARELLADLDRFRMDWSLVEASSYVRPGSEGNPSLCFITSRGCPYNCGFCYNERFHRRKYRAHSVDYVVREVRELKEKTGINGITFDDDHFLANVPRGLEILKKLKDMGVACDWLELRLEAVTRENMEKLRAAGVKRIFFGWESGCDRILKLVNKKFTRETILEKCALLSEFPEIKYDASAIMAFPTETWDETRETIDLAIRMAETLPNVNFNLGTYMPYPGTPLFELAIKEGFAPPVNIEGWKEFDILTGTVDLTWLEWAGRGTKRKLYLIDKYGHFLDRDIASGKGFFKRLAKTVFYRLARFRMKRRLFAFPFEVTLQLAYMERSIRKNLRKFSAGKTPAAQGKGAA